MEEKTREENRLEFYLVIFARDQASAKGFGNCFSYFCNDWRMAEVVVKNIASSSIIISNKFLLPINALRQLSSTILQAIHTIVLISFLLKIDTLH